MEYPVFVCLRYYIHMSSDICGIGVEEISYLGTNLRAVPPELPSTVTRLVGTFAHNDYFNDPNVAQWDVSNVQDMEKIFQVGKIFNHDLSHWDVCNVTNYRPFAPGTPIGRGNSGKTPNFDAC